MSQLMRLWYLSHRRPAKTQASLRIRTVSPELSLFAHMKYGSRQRVWPKNQTTSPTGWLHMRVWRMSLRRTKSTVISRDGSNTILQYSWKRKSNGYSRSKTEDWMTMLTNLIIEPPHDKTNKMSVHPAKTQIRLGRSESLLSAWRKLGSLATHWAHSKDSDQTGQSDWADAQADLRLRWAHSHFVGFVMRRLILSWSKMTKNSFKSVKLKHATCTYPAHHFLICYVS